MLKKQKSNLSTRTSLKDYYDALPHNMRLSFKKKTIKSMGWTEGQWYNRIYGRTELTLPELFVLEKITGEKHLSI